MFVVDFDSEAFILLFLFSERGFLVLVLSRLRVAWKWLVFCFLVLLFFVFMSGLDFVVHRVLYGYGLRFSYDWAVAYWAVYWCVFFVFSVAVGFIYWLASGRSGRDPPGRR